MSIRTVTEWHQLLSNGSVSAAEIGQHYAARTRALEPQIQGFLEVFETPVQHHDSLWSIPIALKDNICLKGHRTTCASRILADFVPPYNATVSEKLLAAGVSVLGKSNLDEFGMGSSCENSAFQITRNPWHLERVPGGSSGGSAALVAAGEVPWSLGSDTGGSIRLPAAYCGIVGMKPTYGRVSRYGLVAYASSLDQIGPMTLTVADNAQLLNLIAGFDPHDSTSSQEATPDFTAQLQTPVKGLKLGLPKEMLGEGVAPEVKAALAAAMAHYAELGVETVEVSLPTLPYALAAYYLIATSEASSNLARYDGVRFGHRAQGAKTLTALYEQSRSEGFGDEVKLRIMLGTFALSSGYYDAYYKKALQVRTRLINEFKQVFTQVDALISPTSPITAFPLGSHTQDPLAMYLLDIMTVPANLAGLPSLALPGGFDGDGLPIGLQLMGNFFSESTLYQLGHAYEHTTEWHLRHPALAETV